MSALMHAAMDVIAQAPVPDPAPKELPGRLGQFLSDVIAWSKTICFGLAAIGVLAVAGMTVVGVRGRSETAKNALTHLPYVLIGVVLTGGYATIIQAMG